MRTADVQPVGALRSDDTPGARNDSHNDASGLRSPISWNGGSTVRASDARMAGLVPPAECTHAAGRPIFGGWQRASGPRTTDGGSLGAPRGTLFDGGPRFDQPVAQRGYQWWYVDALSDDGRHALTLIAFIGSVFSPGYFRARERNGGVAQDYCAMNVALYGRGRRRWSFTEYGRESVQSAREALVIGRNAMSWNGGVLTLRIDERAAPIPSRICGTARLHAEFLTSSGICLDREGLHSWQPLAPRARLEVELEEPHLRWSGSAYFDTNAGSVPLDQSFDAWTWSRADLRDGSAVIYETVPRRGNAHALALQFSSQGGVQSFEPPAPVRLPNTLWRVARTTRSDAATAHVLATLEDGPFYARSVISTCWLGEPVTAIHESLSLERFRSGWVRALLPFRMRRERRR
jgi:carotenoid 1,2-hydratase